MKRKQQKLHDEMVAKAKEKEEELLSQINSLQNKNVELENIKTSQDTIYRKYKGALYEIEDLKREHEYEKESLLDSIRDQQKEIEFYQELLSHVLSQDEIEKIRSHTVWSESQNKYKIPPFIFKEKTIKFPNLTYAQAKGLNAQNKQLRSLEFEIKEENSGELENENNKDDDEKEMNQISLPNLAFRRKNLKINVKEILNPKKKNFQNLKIIEKRDSVGFSPKMFDQNSPDKVNSHLEKKKNYLRTIDTGNMNLIFLIK